MFKQWWSTIHQYQQNEQSPQILTEVAEHKKTMTYDVGNPSPNLEQEQTFGGIKPVNGIPFLITVSPAAIHK